MDHSQDESLIQSFIPLQYQLTPVSPFPSTFQSLPIEIKSLIVKMLEEQDRAYNDRTKNTRLRNNLNLTFGKSLNACFLVDQELSGLAAVHIFRTLPASKIKNDTFKYLILRKRHRLFKRIRFDNVAVIAVNTRIRATQSIIVQACSDEIISILPSLPNISSIIFDTPPKWLLENEAKYGKDLFSFISSNILHLIIDHIVEENQDTAIRLLETFVNVEKLCLGCNRFSNKFRKIVMTLPKLRYFRLAATIIQEEIKSITSYQTSITNVELSSLTSWNLSALAWLQLIPRLESLSLRFDPAATDFATLTLANLTDLSIESDLPIPLSFLTSFSSSPIAHIKFRGACVRYLKCQDIEAGLEGINNLRTFTLGGESIDLEILSCLKSLAHKKGFHLKYQRQERIRGIRRHLEDGRIGRTVSDLQEAHLIGTEIYETLDYARESMKRLEGTGDLGRISQLAFAMFGLRDLYIRDEKD